MVQLRRGFGICRLVVDVFATSPLETHRVQMEGGRRIVPLRCAVHILALVFLLLPGVGVGGASAQHPSAPRLAGLAQPTAASRVSGPRGSPPALTSALDSVAWAWARERAHTAAGRRLVISLDERRLWWMHGRDTLYVAPVAVGKGTRLEFGDTVWEFSTPRGVRRVLGKAKDPIWTPPEWHYVELARDSAFSLVRLVRGKDVPLPDGSRVAVRGDRVGRVHADGSFEPVPAGEEVIYGRTLFIPPVGTVNRHIVGELGPFKLDLGEGFLLHGTPHKDSVGGAVTHGCIRLHDVDIAYLYHFVPAGTRVYIY